ncbi:MAG: iron-containing redox enzyme family protein [Polyangiaceae bacterium]|nr:iron-containing redox enzyme family protein [Polyangiaceae bacterium]
MQSWVAYRRHGAGDPRLTIYLATEAGKTYPRGAIPAATGDRFAFASAEAVVRCMAEYDLAEHPFVRRLMREKDSAGATWQLVRSTYEGTSKHFVPWLAMVTARVPDNRMRCLLARQLDQELGEGDLSRAHSHLMVSFLEAIEPLRPLGFDDSRLEIGARLGRRLEAHYMSEDGLEGAAALMAGEICAHQLIHAVGELLKKQPHRLDPAKIDWLTQHDELEGGHAEESLVLARFVPETPDAIASIRRGAMGTHDALWASLDELYIDCFGRKKEAR